MNQALVKSMNQALVKSMNQALVKSMNQALVKSMNQALVKSMNQELTQCCNAFFPSQAASNTKNLDVGANVFIGNLDTEIDEKLLYDIFSAFGVILQTPKVGDDIHIHHPLP